MKKLLLTLTFALCAGTAWAGEGILHATEWVTWRDGGRIVNFLVLFAGVYWIIKRVAVPFFKNRTEEIAKQLEEAEAARMDAQKKLGDLEYRIHQFERESEKLREEAAAESARIKQQIIDDANHVAERIVGKAKAEIESETHKAELRLRKETVELAIKLATGTLNEKLETKDHHSIVEQYAKSLGEMK